MSPSPGAKSGKTERRGCSRALLGGASGTVVLSQAWTGRAAHLGGPQGLGETAGAARAPSVLPAPSVGFQGHRRYRLPFWQQVCLLGTKADAFPPPCLPSAAGTASVLFPVTRNSSEVEPRATGLRRPWLLLVRTGARGFASRRGTDAFPLPPTRDAVRP